MISPSRRMAECTLIPLRKTPFRLSKSCMETSCWRHLIRACRRDTLADGKGMSAFSSRPMTISGLFNLNFFGAPSPSICCKKGTAARRPTQTTLTLVSMVASGGWPPAPGEDVLESFRYLPCYLRLHKNAMRLIALGQQAPSSKTDLRSACPGICFGGLVFSDLDLLRILRFGAWCFSSVRMVHIKNGLRARTVAHDEMPPRVTAVLSGPAGIGPARRRMRDQKPTTAVGSGRAQCRSPPPESREDAFPEKEPDRSARPEVCWGRPATHHGPRSDHQPDRQDAARPRHP